MRGSREKSDESVLNLKGRWRGGGGLWGESERGGLLLGLVDAAWADRGLPSASDGGRPLCEHQVETIVGQRIFGLVLGYEDLNDQTSCARIQYSRRWRGSWPRCCVRTGGFGAGKSTLNRVEHTRSGIGEV